MGDVTKSQSGRNLGNGHVGPAQGGKIWIHSFIKRCFTLNLWLVNRDGPILILNSLMPSMQLVSLDIGTSLYQHGLQSAVNSESYFLRRWINMILSTISGKHGLPPVGICQQQSQQGWTLNRAPAALVIYCYLVLK